MSTPTRNYLALDLGAESGRALLFRFDGAHLGLEEVHRFANRPVQVFDHLYWNALGLFSGIEDSLALYRRNNGAHLDAIGIDTWGVDFALLGRGDVLLESPRNYRDPRTDGMIELAFNRVARADIFAATGVQFLKINSLYQLLAMKISSSPILEMAETFLMMADLFNFFLTGIKTCEFTNATTTQFYDSRHGRWAWDLLRQLELPSDFLPAVATPGTVIGPLLPAVAKSAGLAPVSVVAPATHDTGSAVVAVPTLTTDYAFISSGTWSLMGIELTRPRLDRKALSYNFTNEGGAENTYRFLKNIMGLWLVQECRRTWERNGHSHAYGELAERAAVAPPFLALVDPDDDSFLAPGDMPKRIRAFCKRTGQCPPTEEGATIRLVLESLALKYRHVLDRLEEFRGRRLDCIHIVGGGVQNRLLCQFTANACNRPVIAGPAEATATGNAIMQAIGSGDINSVADGRQLVRNSFPLCEYEPTEVSSWNAAYARILRIL